MAALPRHEITRILKGLSNGSYIRLIIINNPVRADLFLNHLAVMDIFADQDNRRKSSMAAISSLNWSNQDNRTFLLKPRSNFDRRFFAEIAYQVLESLEII